MWNVSECCWHLLNKERVDKGKKSQKEINEQKMRENYQTVNI